MSGRLPMKIYLDNSVLNRPFDNPEISQNRLDSEILFLIFNFVEEEKIVLVNSAVIEFENSLNPFPERKVFVEDILKSANVFQNLNEKIYFRAKEINKGFTIADVDALHLATAEFARVDYFITCDYDIIKRYEGKIKTVSPSEFFSDYEKPNR